MPNDNEVKFTASVKDEASPAIKKMSENTEELSFSAKKASSAVDKLEASKQAMTAAFEKAAQANRSANEAVNQAADLADKAAMATENREEAEYAAAQASEKAAQALHKADEAAEKAAAAAQKYTAAQDKVSSSSGVLSNALERVKKGFALDVVIGNLVTQGINFAVGAFQQLASTVIECVYEFANAEMVTARLDAALANQGITSKYVSADLDAYAKSIRAVSGADDDVIKDGMRLLINFGLLGDELKQATNSAFNLSVGMGTDLNSAFQLIAKAAEGNVSMLSRYGVTVDTTKDKSEQFASALAQIDKKFGNLAGANADNLVTKTNVLKETWGDFKEQIGAAFEPLQKYIVELLTGGVEKLQSGFRFLTDIITILAESAVQGFNYMDLGILTVKKATQGLIVKSMELRNIIGLISDETLEANRKELDSIDSQISAKREQIELFKKSTEFLASDREAMAANTEESKKAGEQQIAEAQKRIEAEKKAAEAREKQAEAHKKAEEDRERRINDFAVNARKERYDSITAVIMESSAAEQAELISAKEKEYEAQLAALDARIGLLDKGNEEELARMAELNAEKNILREEFDAYNQEIDALQLENKIIATDEDIERARRAEELKLQFASAGWTTMKQGTADLASFQNAKTKALMVVGKTAAIANAIMNTYQAANLALANVPPPWGYVQAAISTAMGLANVAQISGVQLAVGTANVPEDMPATVHRGEIIVPRTFSEGLRAGDLALGAPDVFNNTENTQASSVTNNFIFNGDILSDSPDSIAEKLGQATSELIAGGRMAPFPTGERM